MIVEDEKGISDAAAYALRNEGFRVEVAGTGGQALKLLAKAPFDILILDVGLPDINGFDLFHKIREKHKVPVIFLTARSEEADRVAGLEMGGDDYLSKPFSPRELAARVRAILRRMRTSSAQTPSTETARQGPLRMDFEAMIIKYHGQSLDLSKYEILILKALAEKPGRVLSRDKILDLVWGTAEGPLDRTVDAHVKRLRAKFRSVKGKKDPIRTHRGLGYSLLEDL